MCSAEGAGAAPTTPGYEAAAADLPAEERCAPEPPPGAPEGTAAVALRLPLGTKGESAWLTPASAELLGLSGARAGCKLEALLGSAVVMAPAGERPALSARLPHST